MSSIGTLYFINFAPHLIFCVRSLSLSSRSNSDYLKWISLFYTHVISFSHYPLPYIPSVGSMILCISRFFGAWTNWYLGSRIVITVDCKPQLTIYVIDSVSFSWTQACESVAGNGNQVPSRICSLFQQVNIERLVLCIEYASDIIYEILTCQSYFMIKVLSICDLLTIMLEIPSSGNTLKLAVKCWEKLKK